MDTPLDIPRRKPLPSHEPYEQVAEQEVGRDVAEELMRNRWNNATVHIRYGRSFKAKQARESPVWRAWQMAPSARHRRTIHVITEEAVCHVFGMKGEYITVLFAKPRRLLQYVKDEEDISASVLEWARSHAKLTL